MSCRTVPAASEHFWNTADMGNKVISPAVQRGFPETVGLRASGAGARLVTGASAHPSRTAFPSPPCGFNCAAGHHARCGPHPLAACWKVPQPDSFGRLLGLLWRRRSQRVLPRRASPRVLGMARPELAACNFQWAFKVGFTTVRFCNLLHHQLISLHAGTSTNPLMSQSTLTFRLSESGKQNT